MNKSKYGLGIFCGNVWFGREDRFIEIEVKLLLWLGVMKEKYMVLC